MHDYSVGFRICRRLDAKCAEVLGWKEVKFKLHPSSEESGEWFGTIPSTSYNGGKLDIVPYFSMSVQPCFSLLVKHMKDWHIRYDWNPNTQFWTVAFFKSSGFKRYSSKSLPFSITMAFLTANDINTDKVIKNGRHNHATQ